MRYAFDPTPYLNIPYVHGGRTEQGLDCWGLVIRIYEENKGIVLPSYSHINPADGYSQLSGQVAAVSLHEDCEVVDDIQPYDIVLLNCMGQPFHVACAINDKEIIHTTESTGVVVEKVASRRWKNRIKSIHRLSA